MSTQPAVATQPDTKQRILDAAERLFAREGYNNTSLRAITGEADVNLAAVNYHFGSKEALLEAVFERRLVPLNQVRRQRLEIVGETAQREERRPSPRETLAAFIEPTLAFRESAAGAGEFSNLVGRAIIDPDDTVRKIFLHHIEPIFHLLFDTLREALPDLPPDKLFWRVQFSLGAMGHTIHMRATGDDAQKNGKFKCLPHGIISSCDAASMTDMLLTFITAGMEAP